MNKNLLNKIIKFFIWGQLFLVVIVLYLMKNHYITIPSQYAFLYAGIILIIISVLGLVSNSIILSRGDSLEYSKKSIMGKIGNVFICILGIGIIVIYIYLKLSS